MAQKWHGAGELWKGKVETRQADKTKRKEFYGDKALKQVATKLLRDSSSLKPEEIPLKLKERADITKNEAIIKARRAPEKIAKGRLISALLEDFFKTECGSAQATADALIALKYLNADMDNVDWVDEGETVSIENAILTVKNEAGEVVARGSLIPRDALPSGSPEAMSRKGTVRKRTRAELKKVRESLPETEPAPVATAPPPSPPRKPTLEPPSIEPERIVTRPITIDNPPPAPPPVAPPTPPPAPPPTPPVTPPPTPPPPRPEPPRPAPPRPGPTPEPPKPLERPEPEEAEKAEKAAAEEERRAAEKREAEAKRAEEEAAAAAAEAAKRAEEERRAAEEAEAKRAEERRAAEAKAEEAAEAEKLKAAKKIKEILDAYFTHCKLSPSGEAESKGSVDIIINDDSNDAVIGFIKVDRKNPDRFSFTSGDLKRPRWAQRYYEKKNDLENDIMKNVFLPHTEGVLRSWRIPGFKINKITRRTDSDIYATYEIKDASGRLRIRLQIERSAPRNVFFTVLKKTYRSKDLEESVQGTYNNLDDLKRDVLAALRAPIKKETFDDRAHEVEEAFKKEPQLKDLAHEIAVLAGRGPGKELAYYNIVLQGPVGNPAQIGTVKIYKENTDYLILEDAHHKEIGVYTNPTVLAKEAATKLTWSGYTPPERQKFPPPPPPAPDTSFDSLPPDDTIPPPPVPE